MSGQPTPTGDAEFDKPSLKVESIAARNERKRWADLPEYPKADPWQATSYLISGVLLWGLLGYAAARWLDIPFLTGVGMLIGGVLGIWLTYLRYGRPQSGPSPLRAPAPPDPAPPDLDPPDLPRASDPPHPQRAERPSGSPSDPIAEEEKP